MLLTGGSGFIGREVLARLRERGDRVTVLDLAPVPAPFDEDPGVDRIAGDLTTDEPYRVLEERLDRDPEPPTAIVHLAAVTSVLGSKERPEATFRLNVACTQRLLELARTRGIAVFVLASTNAVTGDVGTRVIDTEIAPTPLTPYGATKAAAEMLVLGYAGSYDLAGAALRFTNVYGPGMAAKDSFVPRMMRAALSGDTVKVYGTGRQSRDLVHVSDAAAGVLAAIDRRFTGRAVIGSGESVTVLELVDRVRAVTGRPLPAEHVPAPKGEMPAVRVDVRRSLTDLGWAPRVGLDEGLAGVWRDFRGAAADG